MLKSDWSKFGEEVIRVDPLSMIEFPGEVQGPPPVLHRDILTAIHICHTVGVAAQARCQGQLNPTRGG